MSGGGILLRQGYAGQGRRTPGFVGNYAEARREDAEDRWRVAGFTRKLRRAKEGGRCEGAAAGEVFGGVRLHRGKCSDPQVGNGFSIKSRGRLFAHLEASTPDLLPSLQ